jgi:hypothetical protein
MNKFSHRLQVLDVRNLPSSRFLMHRGHSATHVAVPFPENNKNNNITL